MAKTADSSSSGADSKGKKKGDDEKPKETVPIHRLFRYADWRDIIFMIIGTIFAAAHGCGWPMMAIVFGDMTNDFLRQGVGNASAASMLAPGAGFDFTESMNRFALYFVLIAIGVFVACFTQVALWQLACERQAHRLKLAFFKAVLRQEMSWYDEQSSGELTTRLADDLDKIRAGIGDKTSVVAQSLSGFLAGFIIGFVKSWKMTLVMMSLTPVMAACAAVMGKFLSSMSAKEQEAYAKAGSVAEETIGCIRTVTAFCGQEDERLRYEKELQGSRREGIKKGVIQGFGFGFVMLALFSAYCLAFWYGGTQVKEWQETGGVWGLPPGDIFTVFFCVMIGSFAIGMAGQPFSQLVSAQGAAGTIFKIIDTVPSIDASSEEGLKPKESRGAVELRNVEFTYPTRPDVPVLQGVSLKIEPGQTVALTGPSGCGKSSIVKMLLRFYDPSAGEVMLDGNNIRDLHVHWYRSRIGLVSQEPVLFSCSIRENIRMGREDVTDEEMVEACIQANAHKFISKLPDGYDTLVGERGAQLSGGQKQRVAIARALVRRPAILLLDEATSALDAESEGIVQDALDRAGTGVTTLVIAHRLSTIRNADLILAIDEGKVAEAGTHDELMKKQGLYYQLVSLQQIASEEEAGKKGHRRPSVSSRKSIDNGVPNGEGITNANYIAEIEEEEEEREASEGEEVAGESRAGSVPDVKFAGSADKRRNSKKPDKPLTRKEREKEMQKEVLKTAPGFLDIMKLNKPELPYLLLACLGSLLNGAGMPVFAVFFAEVITVFSKTGEELMREVTLWACMFLVLGFSQFLGNIFSNIGLAVSGERLTCRLRTLYFRGILRQDMSFFDNPDNSVGALTTRLATDASNVKGAAGPRLAMPLQAIFGVLLGVGIALYFGWQLALMILACLPVMAIAGAIDMAYQTSSKKAEDDGSEGAGQTAAEAIENLPTVQGLCREDTFYKRYHDYLAGPYTKRLAGSAVAGLTQGFAQCVIFFVYAASFRFGAYLVEQNLMEVQNVFKVFFSITFAGLMVGQVFSIVPNYAQARVSAAKILELLNRKPLIDNLAEDGDKPKAIEGELCLEDVEFAYPQRTGVEVLRSISLRFPAGKTVALVGISGCGKSTVMSLLQRMYDPTAGSVKLDGKDIRSLNVNWLRQNIRVVSQEPTLFARSIGENIIYGLEGPVTQDGIEAAAKESNIHDFVQGLPDKYDTEVGERGAQLSGGQKQRVALARALVNKPKILLLDEATSALDTESEAVVQAALEEARQGRTCVLIAHRLSTVQSADCIIVVEQGKVIEQGTHAELMAKRGAYYALASGGSNQQQSKQ